jgi:hypothetical protein
VTSFEVMGPELPNLPEGVMVLSPVYVGADWTID